jgi:hypothetical protein
VGMDEQPKRRNGGIDNASDPPEPLKKLNHGIFLLLV